MSVDKERIKEHILISVNRFSDELADWSRSQFEKLISSESIGGPFKPGHSDVVAAIQELEKEEIIRFVGDEQFYIVLHPEYIKKNLNDYVMRSSLEHVEKVISKYLKP